MKKLLFVIMAAVLLAGCQSKEEKAQELIKKDMFTTLDDFDSYEPVETKLDSAFNSPYIDKEVRTNIDKLDSCFIVALKNSKKLRKAVDDMRLWVSSTTHTGRYQFQKADETAKECSKKSDEIHKELEDTENAIKNKIKETKRDFIGWETIHKFRNKDKNGEKSMHNYLYIFDKDMKNIIYKEDMDDKVNIRIRKDIKSMSEPDGE